MSRAWYLTALVPLALGLAIAGVSCSRLVDNLESMQRLVVPAGAGGERTFVLNAGEYVGYGETESFVDGTAYRFESIAVRCELWAEDGTPIRLERTSGKRVYSLAGFSGGAMFEFALAAPGTVRLRCDSEHGAVVAIGGGIGAAIAVAVVCAIFGVMSAVAVFVVVLVRRRRYLALVAARDNR